MSEVTTITHRVDLNERKRSILMTKLTKYFKEICCQKLGMI